MPKFPELTAEFIRPIDGWKGDARLFKLSRPATDDDGREFDYIIVSAVTAYITGPETLVFPATAGGETHFNALPGSFHGPVDHDAALAGFLRYENAKTN